ncbi:MAG: hypothetical protein LQ340_006450, partial [Diploschistes diacapsis]
MSKPQDDQPPSYNEARHQGAGPASPYNQYGGFNSSPANQAPSQAHLDPRSQNYAGSPAATSQNGYLSPAPNPGAGTVGSYYVAQRETQSEIQMIYGPPAG